MRDSYSNLDASNKASDSVSIIKEINIIVTIGQHYETTPMVSSWRPITMLIATYTFTFPFMKEDVEYHNLDICGCVHAIKNSTNQ